MMVQFVVRYIPGGMSLNHGGWWLCRQHLFNDGSISETPIRMIRKSDYS